MISKSEIYPQGFDWVVVENDLPEEFHDFPGVLKNNGGGWRVSKSARLALPDALVSALAPLGDAISLEHDREVVSREKNKSVYEILRAYQREAVEFARSRTGCGIALHMGGGKTLCACTSVCESVGDNPVLIIGPLISRGIWCGEKSDLTKYFGINCLPLEGRKGVSKEPFSKGMWFHVNFDVLNSWQPWISHHLRPHALIVEESHYIKGPRSQRTREVHNISRLSTIKKRLFLTGTPILNRSQELWPQLQAIAPDQFGSYFAFRKRYCQLERGPYGWISTGLSNEDELRKRLQDVIFYRPYSEVMKELPSITRQNIEVDLDSQNRQVYNEIWADVRRWYRKNKLAFADGIKGEALVRITKLLQTCSIGKIDSTLEIARNALDSHRKIVVFTYFRETASKIASGLKNCAKVYGPFDGSVDIEDRIKGSEAFAETSSSAVFIGTMDAVGVSLNALACASCVVFSDLTWVPAKILQAEKRVHRPGQSLPVNAIYVTATDTIDGDLFDVLSAKANTIERTMGDDSASNWIDDLGKKEATSDEITMLVKALEKRFSEQQV